MTDRPELPENADEKTALIESLRNQSAEEIVNIRKQTEQEIQSRRRSVEALIQRIHDEEKQRVDAQIALMEKRANTNINIEKRRKTLAMQKQLIEHILERSEEKAQQILASETYRNAMMNWIVEGILGLDTDSITVETTAGEAKLIEELIPTVEARFTSITGNTVSIRKGTTNRVGSPGVIIRDNQSARAFDNTISTRMERFRSDIQRLIANRLYTA